MELTEREKKICQKYSEPTPTAIWIDGDRVDVQKVHCNECPLVIDRAARLCRANAAEEDLENYT